MSLVTPQHVPTLQPMDWAIVGVGLGIGISAIFFILSLSVSKKEQHRVYTWTNFWLVMSGVIHVNYFSFSNMLSMLFDLQIVLFVCWKCHRCGLSSTLFSSERTLYLEMLWICMRQQVCCKNILVI